ncbi:MinD/ParA family protein [Microbacterium sp. cf332]|uniref:MinD/ParA family ATP-binding protein n=1 Tax=Microbacterium sp. cf332 TaxID=1761804 RepID=UPI00089272C7|nr:MinD/ParA family protein [Microbacterium sp. cf332]SDQ19145.1 MinD-like ATPase involved in chromosome partitioning or flagellar assembly [Microbacterium sp. cf332]
MPERNENQPDETDPAVLADSESIHTTAIGIIGGTAQVDVTIPVADDDLDDDDVIDGEVVDDQLATGDIPLGIAPEPVNDVEGEDGRGDAAEDAGDVDVDVDDRTDVAADEADPEQDADDVDVDAGSSANDAEPAGAVESDDPDGATADEPTAVGSDDDASEVIVVATLEDDAHVDDGAGVEPGTDPSAPAPADAAGEPANEVGGEVVVATVVPTSTPITGTIPTTRRQAHQVAEQVRHAAERVQVPRSAEPVLQSRRIGDLEPGRESADLLTADRLLDPSQVVRAEPEGRWQRLVYTVSGHRINLGDGKRARARKELDRRISAPLVGGAKFVPVLSRKGGVGKTTVTTLLGMALADARDDRVIAIDANPDRGTLADRIGRTSGKTVRDLARTRGQVVGFNDLSAIVARDETRLDVLASDTDPHVSEAFSDHDYEDVAAVAAHYYSIVLTDTGTGIVHSVMGATLGLSDQIVVVAGLSVDEARLASETLTWLESNGFSDAVKNAIVVLNTSRPGTPMVRAEELETHFSTRVRSVLRIPYDPHLAAGSAVTFRDLDPATREAARKLAASVIEGLRTGAAA